MLSAILSVGIDIGTSTTQVIFSRLTMDNMADYFSAPRISIVDKELVYKSRIHTTPLKTPILLDGDGVRAIVEAEYRMAGVSPTDLQTGAVIITGESARKENAALVTDRLSGLAGEFVVSTAGPDLESVIAGKGSGAFQHSIDHNCTVINLDIGGGTTNIVVFDNGQVIGKGCYDIGGRLIRLNADGTVQSVSPAAQAVAEELGVPIRCGSRCPEQALRRITDKMADLLAQSLNLSPESPLLKQVRTPNSNPLTIPQNCDFCLCYSGGVADCIGKQFQNPFQFGDIGILLGQSIRNHPLLSRRTVIEAKETIRATVVGAGTYTTSISGSTIGYAPELFPLKNLPVLKLGAEEQSACLRGDIHRLQEKGRWFLQQNDCSHFVLAMDGLPNPTYDEIKQLARCLTDALDAVLPPDKPLIIILEQDMAKALGFAMKEYAAGRRKIAAIDGILVEFQDYIDIGRPLMDGLVVPVVVKTLVFG